MIFSIEESEKSPALPERIGRAAKLLLGLVLLQIVYGAFVAGLKAGFVFNTFPKMGDSWFPEAITTLEPMWKNFTEGLAGVQFIHRYLALVVVGAVAWLWTLCSRQELGNTQKRALWMIIGMVLIQFSLGVFTLLFSVPILIAVLHQAGAMLLLISVVYFLSGLRHS